MDFLLSFFFIYNFTFFFYSWLVGSFYISTQEPFVIFFFNVFFFLFAIFCSSLAVETRADMRRYRVDLSNASIFFCTCMYMYIYLFIYLCIDVKRREASRYIVIYTVIDFFFSFRFYFMCTNRLASCTHLQPFSILIYIYPSLIVEYSSECMDQHSFNVQRVYLYININIQLCLRPAS